MVFLALLQKCRAVGQCGNVVALPLHCHWSPAAVPMITLPFLPCARGRLLRVALSGGTLSVCSTASYWCSGEEGKKSRATRKQTNKQQQQVFLCVLSWSHHFSFASKYVHRKRARCSSRRGERVRLRRVARGALAKQMRARSLLKLQLAHPAPQLILSTHSVSEYSNYSTSLFANFEMDS